MTTCIDCPNFKRLRRYKEGLGYCTHLHFVVMEDLPECIEPEEIKGDSY